MKKAQIAIPQSFMLVCHPMDLISHLRKNPFILAPMAGITDNPFRSFMKEMGCGIVITELVSAHGIEYGSERTLNLMKFTEAQRPIGVQIFGEDEDIMAKAAQYVEKQGADFVDINLGCPVPKVVKKGAGSALLKDPQKLGLMLKKIKQAISIPLTIKIRTGWDEKSITALEVCHEAHQAGVSWVAIHGRTRAQGYSGQANWDLIKSIKEKAPLPVIGNGDVITAPQAVKRLQQTGCDGIMIGRGCLKNPWIFSQAKKRLHDQNPSEEPKDFSHALRQLKYFLDQREDPRYSALQLKKLSAWFSAGYPGSSRFRKTLFATTDSEEVLDVATNFFYQLRLSDQADTSHESFLMGGHG